MKTMWWSIDPRNRLTLMNRTPQRARKFPSFGESGCPSSARLPCAGSLEIRVAASGPQLLSRWRERNRLSYRSDTLELAESVAPGINGMA